MSSKMCGAWGPSIVTLLALFVIGVGIFTAPAAAAEGVSLDTMEGNGTDDDPYIVTDARELQAIEQDKSAHYVLGNDIDASGTEDWNNGQGFEPIGNYPDVFTGTLDGQGHSVTDLTVFRPGERKAGIFENIGSSGVIKNITLQNVFIRGKLSGGITVANEGKIQDVVIAGEIRADEDNAGGITRDHFQQGLIKRVAVNVTLPDGSQGLAKFLGGPADQVYVNADVVGGNLKSGSFHAIPTGSDGSLRNARVDTDGATYGVAPDRIYSVQQSILNSEVENRVFGEVEGAVRDVYWSPEISGTTSQHGTALSREQMTGPQAREHMDGLDFEEVWAATDDLPVQQWRIQDLSLDLADQQLMVGKSTEVTVTLELAASADTTATTTAEYELNTSAASIENGTLQSTDRGTAKVTASLAGHSDTATVEMLAPPELGVAETTLDESIVARDTTVTVDTTIENVGDLEGTETFGLQVDDETIESTSVTVDGRDEQSVAFRWTPTDIGSYTLAVGEELVGTVDVVEPPEVSVTDASIGVDGVLVGQEATISVTLENPDRLAGSETATLLAEDTVVETRDVTVEAEGTNMTAFTWTPDEPGTYNLTVDSIVAGSVEVVPRSAIAVTEVSATEQVLTDETADVTAEIVNEANVSVDTAVAYALDGKQVVTESVTLEPGTNAVTFEQPLAKAGTATHTVEAVGGETSAETDVREPATVEIANVVSPDTVETGEDAGVTVTVENTGGVAGNDTVTVSVDGATLSDVPVELDDGENTRVSASFSFGVQGEHTFTVKTSDDSTSGTITAESPSEEHTNTDQETEQTTDESGQTDDGETTRQDDEEPESGGGFGPGFGIVATLLAVVALGVALSRLDS